MKQKSKDSVMLNRSISRILKIKIKNKVKNNAILYGKETHDRLNYHLSEYKISS
jgi:hypothetical protein